MPVSFVSAVALAPVCIFVAVIWTPGIRAAEASSTVPKTRSRRGGKIRCRYIAEVAPGKARAGAIAGAAAGGVAAAISITV
jgi:hypothetical protein